MGQGLGLVQSESEFLSVTCPVSVVCVDMCIWSGSSMVWDRIWVWVRLWSAAGSGMAWSGQGQSQGLVSIWVPVSVVCVYLVCFVLTGSGLSEARGYTEVTSDFLCTQRSSANCSVY